MGVVKILFFVNMKPHLHVNTTPRPSLAFGSGLSNDSNGDWIHLASHDVCLRIKDYEIKGTSCFPFMFQKSVSDCPVRDSQVSDTQISDKLATDRSHFSKLDQRSRAEVKQIYQKEI